MADPSKAKTADQIEQFVQIQFFLAVLFDRASNKLQTWLTQCDRAVRVNDIPLILGFSCEFGAQADTYP